MSGEDRLTGMLIDWSGTHNMAATGCHPVSFARPVRVRRSCPVTVLVVVFLCFV